jgi:Holliday junction resolvasome RuvABC ATP-dependent DNA helicase subunit
MSDIFQSLVGQTQLKSTLQFYFDGWKATGRMPFILLGGAKGLGKTVFAETLGHAQRDHDRVRNIKRKFINLNCSSFKKVDQFFEQIFIPFLQDGHTTILFDEAHAMPTPLVDAFLTVCDVRKSPVQRFMWQESEAVFDFRRLTFIFATTEKDKLFKAFLDRMTEVDFREYSKDELAEILRMNLDDCSINDSVIGDIVSTTRGNARSVVKRAAEINLFCATSGVSGFGGSHWNSLKQTLGIKPFGLTNLEVLILQVLSERGACSLQMLSAATGMTRTAIQLDGENQLLKCGFMKIDGQRKITPEGLKVLDLIL